MTGETTMVKDEDNEGGNPLLRSINEALLKICGFGVGGRGGAGAKTRARAAPTTTPMPTSMPGQGPTLQ